MRPLLLIAALDLRRRLRDRSALVTAFVAPIALATLMGFAFGGSRTVFLRVGVADLDRTARSAALVNAGIATASFPPQVAVVRFDSVPAMRAAVDAGRLAGGIVIPAGFGATASPQARAAAQAAAMAPASPERSQPMLASPAAVRIVYPRNSSIGAGVTAALAASVDGRVAAGALAALTSGSPSAAIKAAEIAPPVRAVDDNAGRRANSIGYFGPAMAIIFLFLGAGAGARSVLAERQGGTLARLGVAPVRPSAVILGKVTAVGLTALVSLAAVWAATSLLFAASWGPFWAVLALCVATVFAFVGLALFITASSREAAQAEATTLILGFGLALFGGNFFPPGTLPPLFEKLTLLTPNGWALQGFGSLAIDRSGFGAIVPVLAVLVVIGLAFAVLAAIRLPKALAA